VYELSANIKTGTGWHELGRKTYHRPVSPCQFSSQMDVNKTAYDKETSVRMKISGNRSRRFNTANTNARYLTRSKGILTQSTHSRHTYLTSVLVLSSHLTSDSLSHEICNMLGSSILNICGKLYKSRRSYFDPTITCC